jgi:hypothetical protein
MSEINVTKMEQPRCYNNIRICTWFRYKMYTIDITGHTILKKIWNQRTQTKHSHLKEKYCIVTEIQHQRRVWLYFSTQLNDNK